MSKCFPYTLPSICITFKLAISYASFCLLHSPLSLDIALPLRFGAVTSLHFGMQARAVLGLASPPLRFPLVRPLLLHPQITHLKHPTVSFQWLPKVQTRLSHRRSSRTIRAISSTLVPSAAPRLLISMRVTTKLSRVSQMASIPRTALSQSCISAAVVMSSAAPILRVVVSVIGSCFMASFDHVIIQALRFTQSEKSHEHHALGASKRTAIIPCVSYSLYAVSTKTSTIHRYHQSGSSPRLQSSAVLRKSPRLCV